MRDLRHRLRDYLQRAEAGESFEVTTFGRTVAHLTPPRAERSTWDRLVAEGRLTPAINPARGLPAARPPVKGTTATEALLAERREDER
jgi:antitoxin (DNA-binding transcriptional repressor) of toxin-antitoxin stability system